MRLADGRQSCGDYAADGISGTPQSLACRKPASPIRSSRASWDGPRRRQFAWRSATDTLETRPSALPQTCSEERHLSQAPSKVPKVTGGAECRSAVSGRKEMAPQVGLEPTTLRLTAGCSAIELLRSVRAGNYNIITSGLRGENRIPRR